MQLVDVAACGWNEKPEGKAFHWMVLVRWIRCVDLSAIDHKQPRGCFSSRDAVLDVLLIGSVVSSHAARVPGYWFIFIPMVVS